MDRASSFAAAQLRSSLPLTTETLVFDLQLLQYLNYDEIEIFTIIYAALDRRAAKQVLPSSAGGIYHELALRISVDALPDVLLYVVSLHNWTALVPLLARAKREIYLNMPIMNLLFCNSSCPYCKSLRQTLVQVYRNTELLEHDYNAVRQSIVKARQNGTWQLRKTILWTSPKTDAVFEDISQQAKHNWTSILVACMFASAWKKWVLRQLHPDSSYMRRISERFSVRARDLLLR